MINVNLKNEGYNNFYSICTQYTSVSDNIYPLNGTGVTEISTKKTMWKINPHSNFSRLLSSCHFIQKKLEGEKSFDEYEIRRN